jgi:hypothetical protein
MEAISQSEPLPALPACMAGRRPALINEDFPVPEVPTMATKWFWSSFEISSRIFFHARKKAGVPCN